MMLPNSFKELDRIAQELCLEIQSMKYTWCHTLAASSAASFFALKKDADSGSTFIIRKCTSKAGVMKALLYLKKCNLHPSVQKTNQEPNLGFICLQIDKQVIFSTQD